jgi:hypothetical protein
VLDRLEGMGWIEAAGRSPARTRQPRASACIGSRRQARQAPVNSCASDARRRCCPRPRGEGHLCAVSSTSAERRSSFHDRRRHQPSGYLVTVPSSGPDLNPHGPDLRKACRVGRVLNPAYGVSPGQVMIAMCPRGDLNPHAPFEALAPQASASAYSATRTYARPRYRPGSAASR